MARVFLHALAGDKRAGELANLVGRLYRQGRRIVVWVANDGRRQALDDFLWTYNRLAFLPHVPWSPRLGEVEDPIVLLGEQGNPNRAQVLVVGDDLPPADWAAGFEEVHDLLPPGDAGSCRREHWRASEFELADMAEAEEQP